MIQSLAQLEALYHERARTILDNFDTILYFSGNNPATAKFIAERANKMSWDVLSMDMKDALLIQRGRPPRIVKRFKLEDHPEIMGENQQKNDRDDSVKVASKMIQINDAEMPF